MMIKNMNAENVRMYLRFLYVIFIWYVEFGWFEPSSPATKVSWLLPFYIGAGTMWLIGQVERFGFGGSRMIITFPYGLIFYIHFILFVTVGDNKGARIAINLMLALACFY